MPLAIQFLKQHQHLERGARVEVTGRLVGQQHGRVVYQGSGNSYALHLTTRHLVALVFQTVAQSNGLEGADGSLAALAGIELVVVHQRQLHVLDGRSLRQQVVVLEHEAYLLVAQVGTLCLRHRAHGNAVQDILSAGGRVQTA